MVPHSVPHTSVGAVELTVPEAHGWSGGGSAWISSIPAEDPGESSSERKKGDNRGSTPVLPPCRNRLLLRQLGHRLVEELDALGQVAVQVLQVAVLELDREITLVPLALQLLQHALHVPSTGAPDHVVALAELVQVLEVRVQDPPLELLERIDRDEIGTHPVSCVGAGADQLAAALAGAQHLVRRPGLRVVVQCHLDVELVAEL